MWTGEKGSSTQKRSCLRHRNSTLVIALWYLGKPRIVHLETTSDGVARYTLGTLFGLIHLHVGLSNLSEKDKDAVLVASQPM